MLIGNKFIEWYELCLVDVFNSNYH